MGIPLDGVGRGRGGLCGMEGGAAGGKQSTEKGVGQVRAECTGVIVVNQSIDWNASFANCTWLILWTTVYQASRSVSTDCPKSMVVI